MGEPLPTAPHLPPSSSSFGGSGPNGNDLHETILKELENCGINKTQWNVTHFESNKTAMFLYLNKILTMFNCSYNNGPLPPPENPTPSKPHILLGIYFVTIMVLGLAVNICVIGTICRVRKLRTITNCFVLSLALADLLMAAVVVPLKINELYNPRSGTSPLLDALFPILGVASLLNLCAVTLDRYFTITNPLTYEAKVNGFHAGVVIASVWILSTVQEMIHFAVTKDNEYLFQVIRFVIVFSVPFVCVLFVNAKIYLIARGHARQIRASVPDRNNDSNRRSFSKKMKTAQIIGLLVGTFILTWLPYFIITIYDEHFDEKRYHLSAGVKSPDGTWQEKPAALKIGKVICAALACSTALFNPLLYGFLRKEVRIAIVRGLKCQNVNQMDFDNTDTTTRRTENTTRK